MRAARKRSLSSLLRERDIAAESEKRRHEKEEKQELLRLIEQEEALLPSIPTEGVDQTVRILDALVLATPTTEDRRVTITLDVTTDDGTPVTHYTKVAQLSNDPWWTSIRAWSSERVRFIEMATYDHHDAAYAQDQKVRQLLQDAWERARAEEEPDGQSEFSWTDAALNITVYV